MLDRFDGHVIQKPSWIHTEANISTRYEFFHCSAVYEVHGQGFMKNRSYGVNKKMIYISGHAISIDINQVGKSDE